MSTSGTCQKKKHKTQHTVRRPTEPDNKLCSRNSRTTPATNYNHPTVYDTPQTTYLVYHHRGNSQNALPFRKKHLRAHRNKEQDTCSSNKSHYKKKYAFSCLAKSNGMVYFHTPCSACTPINSRYTTSHYHANPTLPKVLPTLSDALSRLQTERLSAGRCSQCTTPLPPSASSNLNVQAVRWENMLFFLPCLSQPQSRSMRCPECAYLPTTRLRQSLRPPGVSLRLRLVLLSNDQKCTVDNTTTL